MSDRLPEQPGERINRAKVISFEFDGKPVEGLEGDTIGSALFASGQRTFSRSFKYHRRRGLMCCAGQCPNCLVAVDGSPGVRACTEPVREGMKVEHMNASPTLDFDLMAATKSLDTAAQVHNCIGSLLADLVADAIKTNGTESREKK